METNIEQLIVCRTHFKTPDTRRDGGRRGGVLMDVAQADRPSNAVDGVLK